MSLQCVYEDHLPRGPRQFQFIEETPGRLPEDTLQKVDSILAPLTASVDANTLQSIGLRADELSQACRELLCQAKLDGQPLGVGLSSTTISGLSTAATLSPTITAGPSHRPSLSGLCRPEEVELDLPFGYPSSDVSAGSPARHIHDITRQLPPRQCCDALVEGYLNSYHLVVPMVSVSAFYEAYDDLWQRLTLGHTIECADYLALLLSVLYAGSVASPDARASLLLYQPGVADPVERLRCLCHAALRQADFPHSPTLDSLRAYCICQSIIMKPEEPLISMVFVGLAIRAAHILGLHREPSMHSDITAVETEMRRRVWWQIMHIDVMVAVASGLPPLIDVHMWNVDFVSELKEEYTGTPQGMEYELAVATGHRPRAVAESPGTSDEKCVVSASAIFAAGKLKFTLFIQQNLARLSSPNTLSISEILALRRDFDRVGEELDSRVAEIPYPTTAPHQDKSANFHRWARLVLSSLSDQRFCTVQRITSNPYVNAVWPELDQLIVPKSQECLLKCAEQAVDRDFRSFYWSRPGNHQPLDAITILLKDLESSPDGPFASRSRELINMAFALMGSSGGLLAGSYTAEETTQRPLTARGRKVWEERVRLRDKAWRIASLDPSVVWTRSQAIQYCHNARRVDALNHERVQQKLGMVGGAEAAARSYWQAGTFPMESAAMTDTLDLDWSLFNGTNGDEGLNWT